MAKAREIAEAEGWEAVTTRRLSSELGYSQPVLYSHFASMEAITTAVALQGAADAARSLKRAAASPDPVTRLSRAYLRFAREHPAVYEAMSSRAVGLAFGTTNAPAELQAAFDALLGTTGGDEVRAELLWAALHGLAMLERGGRLRRSAASARLRELATMFHQA